MEQSVSPLLILFNAILVLSGSDQNNEHTRDVAHSGIQWRYSGGQVAHKGAHVARSVRAPCPRVMITSWPEATSRRQRHLPSGSSEEPPYFSILGRRARGTLFWGRVSSDTQTQTILHSRV